ncbi:enoyl-CoA hydratase [Agaricicola taiwanensis]|uniref:Enoyl-CoA hydratase n=1 Tax=Agaricicola taiwanensis TaxID=591372 RepID=A0A8J2YDI5_9RHOB|nr:MaoC family dehydratase [Agaricicola taiwanensis]GGE40075.1 enoyl-CoA hydratase [Agaricicola taiwanensis]
MTVCYEDFTPGEIVSYGARTITREEITAFATLYDPQPMHLDEAATANTMLGGLAASGWHTICILMRLNVDHMLKDSASMGAPGVKEVKWLKPVRPGDTLSVRRTTLEARLSQSRPDMGFVGFLFELLNQKGEVVMTQENVMMIGRRGTGDAHVS